MNEEDIKEISAEETVIDRGDTDCQHYWLKDSYQPSGALSLVCRYCPMGMQVDETVFDLSDGQLIKRSKK